MFMSEWNKMVRERARGNIKEKPPKKYGKKDSKKQEGEN